ncbi:MAG: RNA polymerase sigma factor [Chloroflexota bacterium]|nr:RNA polymerase sigma factor [Chloroflexota bacterium]
MSRELVEQAMRGNHDAFAVLAGRSLGRLVGTAGLIVRDRGYAEDAAQDALVRAWRDLPTLRDPDHFDAWLYRLLVHACQDQLRRRRHERTEVAILPEHGTQQEDQTEHIAERDELAWSLGRLTDEQRTIVVLRYYLGLPYPEIAEATGLPIGTVKSRLSRSVRYLEAALAADARITAPGRGPV